MRSFASIAAVATLAFASVASALPVFNVARAPGAVGVYANVGVGAHNVAAVSPRAVVDTSVGGVNVDVGRRDSQQFSVVEIITQVTTTVTPICQNITETVSAQHVDVDAILPVVLNLLGEILTVLTQAKSDIEVAISSGIVPLLLNGKVLDLVAVAQLVGALIVTVIKCLGIVFQVVGGVHAEVLTIIGNIGTILAAIIALVLKVAGGLLAELLPIIEPVVGTILSAGLNTVASVLAIAL